MRGAQTMQPAEQAPYGADPADDDEALPDPFARSDGSFWLRRHILDDGRVRSSTHLKAWRDYLGFPRPILPGLPSVWLRNACLRWLDNPPLHLRPRLDDLPAQLEVSDLIGAGLIRGFNDLKMLSGRHGFPAPNTDARQLTFCRSNVANWASNHADLVGALLRRARGAL